MIKGWIILTSVVVGVDYGWQPAADGDGTEYIIQLEPETARAILNGDEITSSILPQAGNVRSFRVRVGTDELPHTTLEGGQGANIVRTQAGTTAPSTFNLRDDRTGATVRVTAPTLANNHHLRGTVNNTINGMVNTYAPSGPIGVSTYPRALSPGYPDPMRTANGATVAAGGNSSLFSTPTIPATTNNGGRFGATISSGGATASTTHPTATANGGSRFGAVTNTAPPPTSHTGTTWNGAANTGRFATNPTSTPSLSPPANHRTSPPANFNTNPPAIRPTLDPNNYASNNNGHGAVAPSPYVASTLPRPDRGMTVTPSPNYNTGHTTPYNGNSTGHTTATPNYNYPSNYHPPTHAPLPHPNYPNHGGPYHVASNPNPYGNPAVGTNPPNNAINPHTPIPGTHNPAPGHVATGNTNAHHHNHPTTPGTQPTGPPSGTVPGATPAITLAANNGPLASNTPVTRANGATRAQARNAATAMGAANPVSTSNGDRPWGTLMGVLVLAFASLGANIYLGWIAWESHFRYRRILVEGSDYDDPPPPRDEGRRRRDDY